MTSRMGSVAAADSAVYHRSVGADAYLDHLGPGDLEIVLRLAGRPGADPAVRPHALLRSEPGLLAEVLASEEAARLLLRDGADDPDREPIVRASPFLTFAVAVERVAEDLATPRTSGVGRPRQRLPLLGADDLRELLADRVAPGLPGGAAGLVHPRVQRHGVEPTARGWRSQRFSELDPMRWPQCSTRSPRPATPPCTGAWATCSLFLAGVFPDHTAHRAFRPIDLQRLGRPAARRGGRRAGRGARDAGRRRACSTTWARAGTMAARAPGEARRRACWRRSPSASSRPGGPSTCSPTATSSGGPSAGSPRP